MNLKRNEAYFSNTVRGRIVANPPENIKVLAGIINYNLMEALKSTVPEYFPQLNIKEMSDTLQDEFD